MRKANPERTVELDEKNMVYRVHCPYDEGINEILRSGRGRWNQETGEWELRATLQEANEAVRILERDHDFELL